MLLSEADNSARLIGDQILFFKRVGQRKRLANSFYFLYALDHINIKAD